MGPGLTSAGWVTRRAAIGFAALVLLSASSIRGQHAFTPDRSPPASPSAEDSTCGEPAPSTGLVFKWGDVCRIALAENKIELTHGLTTAQIRALGPELEIEGMPGKTSIVISRRSYTIRNVQESGDSMVVRSISASSSALSIEVQRASLDGSQGVVFYQPGSGYSQRSNRGVRLTIYGIGGDREPKTLEAADLTALRTDAPHAFNRYFRPLLRDLGADGILQIDPRTARQVLLGGDQEDRPAATQPVTQPATELATQPTTGPATAPASGTDGQGWPDQIVLQPQMKQEAETLVARLNHPASTVRMAAAGRLSRMGPPAALAIVAMDRSALSPEQNTALDILLAEAFPLPPEEAQVLRRDPHFMIDCMYSSDSEIRSLAVARLAVVAKDAAGQAKAIARIAPLVEPSAAAIEDLRDAIAPATK